MAKLIDIQNSKKKVEELMSLRDTLIGMTPLLTGVNERLGWYEKACGQPEADSSEMLLNHLEPALFEVNKINSYSISLSALTSASGSLVSISGETRTILYNCGEYKLVNEYEEINSVENLFDQALVTVKQIDVELGTSLEAAKKTYEQWKGNVKNNSDLSKDVRAFQDRFKGYLGKIWMTTANKKLKDFSWPKMADTLAKDGPGNAKNLKGEQPKHEMLHTAFTEIMKQTKTCNAEEMEKYVSDYVQHLLVILGCLNGNLVGF